MKRERPIRRHSRRECFRPIKGVKPRDEMTEADKARLAMALDADGCISTSKSKDGSYAYPIFTFKSATDLALKLAKEYYEGDINLKKDKRNPNSRSYAWRISKQKVLNEMLSDIMPYVLLKTKQVDWALQMLELLLNKLEGWKEQTKTLVSKISEQNKWSYNPKLDLDNLDGAGI